MDAIALYRAEVAKRGRPVTGGGTRADRDMRVAGMHRAGESVREIARVFGLSEMHVRRILRSRGVQLGRKRGTTGPTRPRTAGRLTLKQRIRVLERQVAFWRKRAEGVAA